LGVPAKAGTQSFEKQGPRLRGGDESDARGDESDAMRWLSENLRRLAVFMVLLGSLGMLASMLICVADV